MSLQQVRNCNFGRLKANATGSSGVGFTLLDTTGSIVLSRTTSGVYQTAPGIYGAYIEFPDDFRGQILWDTGAAFATTFYATEAYNVEENDPKVADIFSQVLLVSSSIDLLATELNVVSGNVDSASASAAQAAVNSYATYVKTLDISGSLEGLKADVFALAGEVQTVKSLSQDLYDIQFGRWKIIGNQMIFYKADNVTEVARFNLFDDLGAPTMDSVFERVKV
jgi:hypothetical protein